MFDHSFFAGNRTALMKAVKADLILVAANGLLQQSNDEAFPFRQDSNFLYLCGIDEPDAILALFPKTGEAHVLLPSMHPYGQIFDGRGDVETEKLNYIHHDPSLLLIIVTIVRAIGGGGKYFI